MLYQLSYVRAETGDSIACRARNRGGRRTAAPGLDILLLVLLREKRARTVARTLQKR
jgi:hypothetical protein